MLASKYVSKSLKSGINIESKTNLDVVDEENIGELLFDIVVLAKKNKVDPELALQKKCEKFLKETIV